MNTKLRTPLTIIAAGLWISASEFFRNEVLLKTHWVGHYNSLGLTFPSAPLNGAMWGVWSMLFAVAIFIISRKFDLTQTTLLSWFVGFLLMWVVTWNLSVLPVSILVYAVPLSLLEAFVAAYICKRMSPQ